MSQASPSRKSNGTATRDPKRTRERILAAALREFAARGFAGARVDAIARRARINKRMLYHYFGDKEALFREVLSRKIAQRAAWLAAAPDDPVEILPYWFDLAAQDTDWLRLLQWEALRPRNGKLANEEQRRRNYRNGLARLRQGQARGLLSRDYDLKQLLLSMVALTAFPLAFPQITRLVTGLEAGSPEFRRRRAAFLRRFATAFRPKGKSA
jgi:AcrR family transcriptional regulator